jgi:hypothetical protein
MPRKGVDAEPLAELLSSLGPETRARLASTNRALTDNQACIAASDAKIAKLDKQESELSDEGGAARRQISAAALQAWLDGFDPPRPDPALLEAVRTADVFVETATELRRVLVSGRGEALRQRTDAEAAFAGAAFAALSEMQAAQRAKVAEGLGAIAAALSTLLAIDGAYDRFVGGRKLTAPVAKAAPFSATTVVKNLVNHLPIQFHSPAMELAELHRRAAPIAQEIIKFIEDGDLI